MRSARRLVLVAAAAVIALPVAAAVGHELDHPAPAFTQGTPPSSAFQSGGPGAKWELVTTFPTGNPHSDIDFFTRGGDTYASVGTLAVGANGGGQTIVRLTQDGEVKPSYVGAAPTAMCPTGGSATGLQHDAEASPKGETMLNVENPAADRRDAQIVVDATDAPGRCHDLGTLGLSNAALSSPRGGLEIIDVTEPAKPQTIGLISTIGDSHTVNIDPKRPQIAFIITSDAVTINPDGTRANDTSGLGLDGFEVADLSSCMNFAPGTTIETKRDSCRPQVYRYRYPSQAIAEGHTLKTGDTALYACHESEIYPDDRLACASGNAAILFDLKASFDDRGTPADFSDDRPRGDPLPCSVRDSSSPEPPLKTKAKVVDCVTGTMGGQPQSLTVAEWNRIGAPSLAGVVHLGSAHHQGRGAGTAARGNAIVPAQPATEDVDFDHETELTASGRFLISTDERGGGVLPPGAACATSPADNPSGNGGLHAYRVDRLRTSPPANAAEAFESYARTPTGAKAIYRATVRTQPQGSICTAHVFQQIPGQNRIFMGWYSQGTQVVDFVEHEDGSFEFKEAGYFIPANANQWVSAVFRAQENPDGSFSYWGAAGDFGGRNAIDVWKVTLPAPPRPQGVRSIAPAAGGGGAGKGTGTGTGGGPGGSGASNAAIAASGAPACVATSGLRRASARPRGRGLAFDVARAARAGAPTTDVFRQSERGRVIGERLVARFRGREGRFAWNGRGRRPGRAVGDGFYVARIQARTAAGGLDVRRIALERRGGRFRAAPPYAGRDGCGAIRSLKLERPVFGGRGGRALGIAYRVAKSGPVRIEVRRGGRLVRTFRAKAQGGALRRLSYRAGRRGAYRVTLTAGGVRQTVAARRI